MPDQTLVNPPSTIKSAPLTISEAFEARYSAASAISTGSAKRRAGVALRKGSAFCGKPQTFLPIGVITTVGQMAFTHYVMQSVVLGCLFYGYGLGLMGRLGIAAGMAIAVAIYGAQVFISRHWLADHHFGPLEWLWRSLMYGERQAWRRGNPSVTAPNAG